MRKHNFRVVLGLVLLASLVWLPRLALAEGITLSVDPADTPLVIRGTLDGQTTSFSGNVRLTATGGDVSELRLLASEVRQAEDPTVTVDRSQVTIGAGTTLSDGQPRDVRVTVGGVSRPGNYTATLKFLLPGQAEAQALVVPLELHLGARPVVVPISANLNFQLVRCQNIFDCALATWLLPASVVRSDWVVQLDNQTLLPVDVTNATVVMQGEKTGNAVNTGEISLEAPHRLPANAVDSLKLQINRNLLSPDHYQGTLRFKLKETDTPVSVNVSLNLRDGPFWALIVIVLGILVGRLARTNETPEAKMQDRLWPRFYKLQSEVDRLSAPDKSDMASKLNDLKAKVEAAKETEAVLSQILDKLEAQREFLASLEALEEQLENSGLDVLIAELRPKFAAARQALQTDNIAEAQKLRADLEASLRQAQTDKKMGDDRAADAFAPLLDGFFASSAKLTRAEVAPAPQRLAGGVLAQWMAVLSGLQISSEVRFWVVRPLLSLILLVLLALIGLQTLYVNAGATFGAAGIYDYLGVFLWGLSADVASRTLSSLGTGKAA